MKKSVFFALFSIFLLSVTVGLVGCGKEKHTHSFTEKATEETYLAASATCTEPAKYYYSCVCGEKGTETFEFGEPKGHTYSEEWSQSEEEHWRASTCGHDVEKDRAKHSFDSNKKCTVCDYVTLKALGLELQSNTFDINLSTKTVYLKVANAVTDYDFSDKFTVADGARFDVCTDKECNNKISSKKTDIVAGDNIFYILVTNGNNVASYTMTVRRRPIYTVTFDANGGSEVKSQQVEEENYATEPATERKGYDFDEWDYDFSSPIMGDATISAKWNIITYNITYELNGGENAENNPATYTVEDEITLALPLKTGYVGNWNNGGKIEKGSIGDKTFTASYTVDRFNVVVKPSVSDICSFTDKSGVYSYNTPVSLEISDIYLGYEFVGWYNGETLLSADSAYVFTVPASDVTITAKFSVKEEMRNYVFSSTTDSCEIIKVKDEFISSAVVPDYVTSIADSAFLACVNLTSITIPESVTSIGDLAFYMCGKLVEVINKSALNIEKGSENNGDVGYFALNIKTSGKSDIVNKDDYLFYTVEGKNYLVGYVGNDVILTLPESYNGKNYEINRYAFYYYYDIVSITIPESVTAIGDSAFYMSYKLVEVINKSALNIEKGSEDNGLVGFCALNIKTSGKSEIVNKDEYLFYTIDNHNYLLGYTGNDKILILPQNFNGQNYEVYTGAFYFRRDIISVTIPESVTAIGEGAFLACEKLVEVINKSSLVITKGSEDNGGVGYYALNIKTSGDSEIVNEDDYLFYTIDNHNYLLGYTGNETNLTLPQSFNGKNYKIHNFAFFALIYIESVTIPESITSIGEGAFNCCYSLKNIVIPESITSIGDVAFGWCYSLKNIVIPDSVTSIGDRAFAYCSGITSVTIGNGVTSIGDRAFRGCVSLMSITIPENVISIGSYAFRDCRQLKEIVWNAENCTIENPNDDDESPRLYPIFENCSNLTNVIIGENVKAIPNGAFYNCSGLANIYITDITAWCNISGLNGFMRDGSSNKKLYLNNKLVTDLIIPDSVTSIGDYAFAYCSEITSITIPDSVTWIEWTAFEGCSGLTSITIPDGVTSIGEGVFRGCRGLENIYITDIASWCNISGLHNIMEFGSSNKKLYLNNELITDLVIPDSVTSIGDYAFYNCSGITSITIPDSVTSIGSSAFEGCKNLKYNEYKNALYLGNSDNPYVALVKAKTTSIISCEINNKTKIICDFAFRDCRGLTSITIPDSVTSIGSSVFEGCSGLENIYITDIASWCNISGLNGFMRDGSSNKKLYLNNELITDLVIPDGVTSIGGYAFYNCSGITSITIPNSVTWIEWTAFEGCSGLENIYITDIAAWCNISGLNDFMCDGSSNKKLYLNNELVTDLVIPDGVTSIGDYAFANCSGITSVTIPDSVTSIGSSAFEGCKNLKYNEYKNALYLGNSDNPYVALVKAKTTSITSCEINNKTKIICGSAFYNCSGLTSVIIPDSVTSIGESAFRGCSGLENIYITDIAAWCNISGLNGLMYYGSSNKKLYLNNELITDLVIPDSVTSISDYAFYNCSGITSITIPDSVTSIGYNAFEGCKNLKYNEYKDALYLGNSDNPYVVLVKAKTTSITSCEINNKTKIICYLAFRDCRGLKSLTIPDSVTSIGEFAFYNCSGITSVTIGKGVTYIGSFAFRDCSGITSITIPDVVTSIGEGAFYDCSGLTSITIPDNVTSIGYNAFEGCKNLKYNEYKDALYLGNSDNPYVVLVKAKTTSITSCEINNKTKIIYYFAFRDCSGLTSITIPDGVTSIGEGAFWGCSGLKSITIPDTVTYIDYYAFKDCSGLTSVTIGNGVVSIASYAFEGCSSLETVYYAGTSEQWGNISMNDWSNSYLTSATRYYYSETEPELTEDGTAYNGNYWHYDEDGVTPVIWKKALKNG